MSPGSLAMPFPAPTRPEAAPLSPAGEKVQEALDKRWEFWHGLPGPAQVTLVVLGGLLAIRVIRGVL